MTPKRPNDMLPVTTTSRTVFFQAGDRRAISSTQTSSKLTSTSRPTSLYVSMQVLVTSATRNQVY